MFATLIAQRPVWTRNESRPKNTVGRPAVDVSQAVGIHAWPPGERSKSPFWSSGRAARPAGELFAAGAAARAERGDDVEASRPSNGRTTARIARDGLGMGRFRG